MDTQAKQQTQQLSSKALLLLSKLAHAIKLENGVILKLRDHNLVEKLAAQVRSSNSHEIVELFNQFETELERGSISDNQLSMAMAVARKSKQRNHQRG